jgi:hypothetical protein
MSKVRFFSLGFVALALFACGGGSDADSNPADSQSEEALSAGRALLKGAWVRSEDEAFGAQAIYLSPDGTFFRDNSRIVLGVMVNGGPTSPLRDTGTYSVSTANKTVTLHVANNQGHTNSEVYDYVFTPAVHALGIAPRNGHLPFAPAKLTLTAKSAPNVRVAQVDFQMADSYCKSDADCVKERADNTWDVFGGHGRASCAQAIESAANTCELK